MPLLFIDESLSVKTPLKLDVLTEYINDEDRYFLFSGSEGSEVRISYIPLIKPQWDDDLYELYLFENPYLTAENDIFQLYGQKQNNKRLGWIFPSTALDSNEHNFAQNSNFNNYRTIAYKKLLNREIRIPIQEIRQQYTISELFPNLMICLLNKEEIDYQNFHIEEYVLSFMQYDYLIYKGTLSGKKIYDKTLEIDILRKGNHKIKLRKSNFDIKKNTYTKSLFLEHLFQNESPTVRFIFLYQIFEQLIQEAGDKLLDDIIVKYQSNLISKNSLKEQLGRMHNDSSLLVKIVSNTTIQNTYRNNFIDSYKILCSTIGEETKKDLAPSIYSFRNLFTHRYRVISDKNFELNKIIQYFEILIIEYLISYNVVSPENEEKDLDEKTINSIIDKSQIIISKNISLWDKFLLVIKFHYQK